MYLLATDTVIYSLKGDPHVVRNLRLHATEPMALSVITYGELLYGARKSKNLAKNLAKIHRLREIYPIIEISCAIMDTFSLIKADLSSAGRIVDDFDLLIGATALNHGYRIITNNVKHFNIIPDLKVINWTS